MAIAVSSLQSKFKDSRGGLAQSSDQGKPMREHDRIVAGLLGNSFTQDLVFCTYINSVEVELSYINQSLIVPPENYSAEIYAAILLATTRSLVTLAESSGCEGEAVRAASRLSDAPSSTP
jgi:hypothetical protein